MRRFRDLINAHKRFSFGVWIVVLVVVVAGAQWQLTSGGSTTRTQVLGAATKKPDTTPPSVSISFPVKNGVYGPDTWTGCVPAGICGTASDATGVSSVNVAVKQGSASYWNGSTPFPNPAAGTTPWSLPLSLPPDGTYTVSVQATDPAGNTSRPVSLSFQVDSTAVDNKAFGISGNAVGPLYPGMAPTPLNLRISNPYNFALKILTVDVTIQSATSPECVVADSFQAPLTRQFTLTTPVVISANTSAFLNDLRPNPPAWPANWPTITMWNNPTVDQGACKDTTFNLTYTGTATK